MAESGAVADPLDLLTLGTVRRFLRQSGGRAAAVFFGLVYAIGAMLWSGMLILAPSHLTEFAEVVWSGGPGTGSWNFPALVVGGPWGVLTVPFFAGFTMVVVAIGVGYGMATAFFLVLRLLRPVEAGGRPSGAFGTASGLTPAMISLVTLGACCSTTSVATAGVGLVAAATGTTVSALLLSNWYLGVFQMVIVWVALLAQELLLVVYGGLYGLEPIPGVARLPARYDRRFLVGGLLRIALLAGGVLWCLGAVADWTTTNPSTAGAGWWFRWVFEREVVGTFAVVAAFFPVGAARWVTAARRSAGRWSAAILEAIGFVALTAAAIGCAIAGSWLLVPVVLVGVPAVGYAVVRWGRAGLGYATLGLLLVGAVPLLLWVPPPLPAWGVDAFGNVLLGGLGAPAAWGAIHPAGSLGVVAIVRWGLGYLVVGGFAVLAVVAPERTWQVLLWTVGPLDPAVAAKNAAAPAGPGAGSPSTTLSPGS